MLLERCRTLLAALWAGALLAVALIAAPSAFEVLERAQAGRLVARVFELEAFTSCCCALLLMMFDRRIQRDGGGTAITAGFLLPAGAFFSVVSGYYGLLPMMEAARAGQGSVSFLTLHAISMGFYGLRTLLALALAWRLAAGLTRPRAS